MKTIDSPIHKTTELIKRFPSMVCKDEEMASNFVTKDTAFTRNRTLTLESMLKLVLLGLKSSYASSVPIALGEMLQDTETPLVKVSKAAYCQRRQLLDPNIFRCWNDDIVSGAYEMLPNLKLWHGLRAVGGDGTTTQVPDSELLAETFGRHSNDKGEQCPMIQAVMIADLLNDIILDINVCGIKEAERNLLVPLIDKLGNGDLLILDRGYPSFWLIYLLMTKGIKFIIRVPKSFSNTVKKFVSTEKDDGDIFVEPTRESIKKLKRLGIDYDGNSKQQVRIVKFRTHNGSEIYALTNLIREEFPVSEISNGYHLRWQVEIDIFFLKNTQQIEVFSGRKPICILQDIYAAVPLYNICSIYEYISKLTIETDNEARKLEHKRIIEPDRNVSFSMVRHYIVCVFFGQNIGDAYSEAIVAGIIGGCVAKSKPHPRPRIKRVKRKRGRYYSETNWKSAMDF